MKTIAEPANYVEVTALAFGNVGDEPTTVSATTPLPVALSSDVAATLTASQATLEAIDTAMTTPVAQLPPTPISDGSDFSGVAFDFSSATDQEVVVGVSAEQVRVYRARLYFSGACTLSICDGTSAQTQTVKEKIQVPSAGMLILDGAERMPYWATTAGKSLVLKCSTAAVEVTGRLTYKQV